MKTYVWTIPMRIFHWMLVLGLIAAYFLSEEDELLKFHVAFGYSVGMLIIYRIVYGFLGAEYSRFSAFPVRISSIRKYASNIKGSKSMFMGHNPFSAVVMLLIFIDVLLVVFTGILSLASMNQGIFKNLITHRNNAFRELHETFVNILIVLVIMHLAGLIIDRFQNKEAQTIKSIFTGYKNGSGTNIKENRWHNILFIAVIIIITIVFAVTMKSDITGEDGNEHQFQHEEEVD